MNNDKPWTEKWIEINPLSGGGQGDTILVKSLSNEATRAVLKLLKPHKTQDTKSRGRMAQEVMNLKILRNAGGQVPQVLDGNTDKFEVQNIPLYFVMEFVEGDTLAKSVQDNGGLSVDKAVGVALSLCGTMRVAIKEGIVHRDIKPENIIVRSLDPPEAVMVDFGLSFNEEESLNLTSADESLDNKFISLPERRGPGENKRDFRSDLTGICTILFYCITKCSPRNLQDSQGRPPHRWPDYLLSGYVKDENQQSSLNLLFNRGFSYEIDSRFQTIDELIGRLEEIIRPDKKSLVEDLDVVIAREEAALRKKDRKTQLGEHLANALTLGQPMGMRVNEINTKLNKRKTFILSWSGLAAERREKTEIGDIIAACTINIGVQNHAIKYSVIYNIASRGTECAVYRAIHENQPGAQNKVFEPIMLISRYQGDSNPNAAAVVADIQVAVTKSIAAISQKVQSGY
jgi:serine/threonine protein kinase